MRKVAFLYLSILLLSGCSKNEERSKGVDTIAGLSWHLDMQRGFSLAKKEGKDVIVMVGEDSCRWCKKMKERTLTDTRIQEKMKKYVLVSIKRSDKDSVKQIAEFDGNIPSFFFMHANKELIEPVVGYFKADDFLSYIQEVEE